MVWLFSRNRTKRLSASGPSTTHQDTHELSSEPNFAQKATPRRSGPRSPEESSLGKRRRSSEQALEIESVPINDALIPTRGRSSVDRDMTALPGARRMERSPHLRRSSVHRMAIPYNSGPPPASRLEAMKGQVDEPRLVSRSSTRRLSKRKETKVRALREEEIRAMSAHVQIPNRNSGHGDMLNRENKKARRRISKTSDERDNRGSIVSLPFQDSIHSSMSGVSEKRGWEIPGLKILSPRPNVRQAGSASRNLISGGQQSLSRNGSKKEKLSTLQKGAKKDRRRMAELADDLDASDLRVLMERDTRRREKKIMSDRDKLDAKLRRRAERQRRASEVNVPPVPPTPPTAIHPAFRQKPPPVTVPVYTNRLPTPVSDKEDGLPGAQNTVVESSPFRDPSPTRSPFDDLYSLDNATNKQAFEREDTPQSMLPTPRGTPGADSVLNNGLEFQQIEKRYSQVSATSPASPIYELQARNMSPLRREYTPDLPPIATSPVGQTELPVTKKPGTWASIFRRGTVNTHEQSSSPQATTSFSNTSRDSMSRQPLPAHLVGNTSRRRSGTPARTQSIFREDLPESSASPPMSRINTPDNLIAGGAADVGGQSSDDVVTGQLARGRTPESQTHLASVADGRVFELAGSTSLASIDSEGSWLTGRPSKRKSATSHVRNSLGSSPRRHENLSYEDLGLPDEDHVRRLTPYEEVESPVGNDRETNPNIVNDSDLLRRNTSRRRPQLVTRDDGPKSRQGYVADMHTGDSPVAESATSQVGSSLDSASEYDDYDSTFTAPPQFLYGPGHARQVSSGSAKLMNIPARSGQNTPNARMSLSSSPDAAPALPALAATFQPKGRF